MQNPNSGTPVTLTGTVKAFLLANPLATNDTVAKNTSASTSLISKVRKAMEKDGLLLRSYYNRRSNPDKPLTLDEDLPIVVPMQGTKEILDLLEQQTEIAGEMTPEEQRKFLTSVARDKNEAMQIRMAAMVHFNKLAESTSERDALGPGKPLTNADRRMRMSLLMRACGPALVLSAYKEAFEIGEEAVGDQTLDTPNHLTQAQSTTPVEEHGSLLHGDQGHDGAHRVDAGGETPSS